jgi:hypothetical protein
MIIGRLEANYYERNTFRRKHQPSWEILVDEITGEFLEVPSGTKVQVEVSPGKWMEFSLDPSTGQIVNGMWVKVE